MGFSNRFMISIKEALNKIGFVSQDFDLLESGGAPGKLTIVYKYNTIYYFQIIYDESIFKTAFKPGRISLLEIEKVNQLDSLFLLIERWLNNINSEFETTPIGRKLSQHDDIILAFQKRIEDIEDAEAHFSDEEGELFKSRLDELENSFREKLQADEDLKIEFERDIQTLHEEITSLKRQLNVFTKKNWFLAFSTKLFLWSKRHPQTVRQIAGVGRDMLPEEVRDAVSDDALDLLLLPPEDGNAS
jgi:hypothetical protein